MCEPNDKCKEHVENLRHYLNDIKTFLHFMKCPVAQALVTDTNSILESLPTFEEESKCDCDPCTCTDCSCGNLCEKGQDQVLEEALQEVE